MSRDAKIMHLHAQIDNIEKKMAKLQHRKSQLFDEICKLREATVETKSAPSPTRESSVRSGEVSGNSSGLSVRKSTAWNNIGAYDEFGESKSF